MAGLSRIIDAFKVLEYCRKQSDAQERLEHIEQLLDIADGFEADTDNVFEVFLIHACLGDEEGSTQGIQLMTIHASKGLEFKYVFLVGVEEGILPAKKANVEEERRLMYVAITRAKELLYMSYVRQRMCYGSVVYQKPSCFIGEIPNHLLMIRSHNKPLSSAIRLTIPSEVVLTQH